MWGEAAWHYYNSISLHTDRHVTINTNIMSSTNKGILYSFWKYIIYKNPLRDCTICLDPANPSKHKQIRTIPLSTTSHSNHFQSHQPGVPAANVQVCTKRPRDVSSKRTERSSSRTWRWNRHANPIVPHFAVLKGGHFCQVVTLIHFMLEDLLNWKGFRWNVWVETLVQCLGSFKNTIEEGFLMIFVCKDRLNSNLLNLDISGPKNTSQMRWTNRSLVWISVDKLLHHPFHAVPIGTQYELDLHLRFLWRTI